MGSELETFSRGPAPELPRHHGREIADRDHERNQAAVRDLRRAGHEERQVEGEEEHEQRARARRRQPQRWWATE